MKRFQDRAEAGRQLAKALSKYRDRQNVIVLAVPRGGVPVGYEVARALEKPLDVILVRKLGVPGREELAMGAIATGGVRVLNDEIVEALRIPETVIDQVAEREQRELERRERVFRGDRAPLEIEGRTVILVDDGIATGATMLAAIRAVRSQSPARTIVAIPVAPASVCEQFRLEVDELICLLAPDQLYGVGFWYDDFRQTSDDEVRLFLDRARNTLSSPAGD